MNVLAEHKLKILQELIQSSGKEELIWVSGYLAGILADRQEQIEPSKQQEAISSTQKITIAYGTETGNSKKLATEFATQAKKSGITAKLVSLDQYRLNDLAKEEFFFTIISTQGEGEPPATAKKFYDHIYRNGFRLDHIKYGVLALGDTSYPLFCKAGEDVDAQLHKLGGKRIVSLQKCDTDYETTAKDWFSKVLQELSLSGNDSKGNGNRTAIVHATPITKKPAVKKTYQGTVITNINLNDRGSAKQTHHIEVAVDGEIDYLPGDSIGIVPKNNPA